MFDPLLATGLPLSADGAAALVIKGLAVGGGFLVGYFLGTAVAWALDRWALAHKAPPQLKKAVSVVAGVALAVLVAMIIFGEGGSGLFGNSGSDGEKKGTPDPNNGKEKETRPEPKVPPKEKEPVPPKATPKPTPGDLHITVLAGESVKDGRFYLFEGDPTPKTFDEFKEAVNARRANTDPPLKTVFYRFKSKGEELSVDHPAVRGPYTWLETLKIGFNPE